MSENLIVVSATVVTTNSEHVARAGEVLARASAGLALAGVDVQLTFGVQEDESDPDQDS